MHPPVLQPPVADVEAVDVVFLVADVEVRVFQVGCQLAHVADELVVAAPQLPAALDHDVLARQDPEIDARPVEVGKPDRPAGRLPVGVEAARDGHQPSANLPGAARPDAYHDAQPPTRFHLP